MKTLQPRKILTDQIVCGLEATGHLRENLFSFLERQWIEGVLLNPFQTHRYPTTRDLAAITIREIG